MDEAELRSYPDNNGNGVPDAFENRPSITEILHSEFDGWKSNEAILTETNEALTRTSTLLSNKLSALEQQNRDLTATLERVKRQLQQSEQRVKELLSPLDKNGNPTITLEMEKEVRSANVGEWVLTMQGLLKCSTYDHNFYRGYVVKRIHKESV